ncbi:short-chain fatty acid transporter [Campylobacter sp. MIT 12-8780]|uniref:short-chain fatty acid transporter n=1 Tax=unclassified Campylobacter TaxID=2593542 RepID=UPI0010F5F743|nr:MULTISPECIES: TIGR00366 family protein [unclassified Campylobacter]TKX28973.1 short-chain fatty acid transporter [Campylobacter sp. MIT 12-5580]TQR40616.1 short-chain fatty acid transporter [Campylobacter sp. MIT 12-8780]
MIGAISSFMTRVVQRYLPDPLVFAIILSVIVFVWGYFVVDVSSAAALKAAGSAAAGETPSALMSMTRFWGDGFWNLLAFTTQMAMIVVTGFALASSEPVKKLLKICASYAKTPKQAVALVAFFGGVASAINWGFGLVIGALFAKQIARNLKAVDYGLLIACAYIGFMTWGGGLSGSMPLSAASADNGIVQKYLAGVPIPLTDTVFTWYNGFTILCLLVFMPILVTYMVPKEPKVVDPALLAEEPSYQKELPKDAPPALKMEESKSLAYIIVLVGVVYLVDYFMKKGFAGLDLNRVNLIFLVGGLALHKTPMAYMRAIQGAARSTAGILVQFPFYAAIALMMEDSGLGGLITDFFIDIANKDNYAVWAFFSSAAINFAVPSGGGHWVIQGPFVLEAAKELGADLGKATMAIAYGEQWANMAQPFWALPALAIAGLGVRDIMGFCITALIFSLPIFVISLWFIP